MGAVKRPSGDDAPGGADGTLLAIAVAVRVAAEVRGAGVMADLAYAVLVIGVFGVLALMLRGLERL